MSWLDAVVLGIIQGLTEFIPVSSDGHLSAAEMLMPRFGQVGLLFDVMVHVGTLAAIVLYYRKLLTEEVVGLVSRDTGERARAWAALDACPTTVKPSASFSRSITPRRGSHSSMEIDR